MRDQRIKINLPKKNINFFYLIKTQ